MKKRLNAVLVFALVWPLAGCAELVGPSCGEFSSASIADQQQMGLDWLVFVGQAPAGTSVTEVTSQVEWAVQKLGAACSTSSPYVRLHMIRPDSLP